MSKSEIVLVTGATGKVGRVFIRRLLAEPKFNSFAVRALCHNRALEPHGRIQNIYGSIEHRATVEKALEGVTHVVHLSTCKETPDQIMDVAVKGLFWLLETCRTSPTFQQFVLIGGDASVGHLSTLILFLLLRQKHSAYPGCYAAFKSARRSDVGTILHSICSQRLLFAGTLDHGEG
jgi:nucleoside-diphosphate-sugar epimerase